MPKIQRKTQKIFCNSANSDQIAVFGSMSTGTPVYSNDVEQLQSNEAYEVGWDAATLEDKAPFMEEMNGVQYGLTYQLAYNFQEGIPEYDAETTYYIGSIVKVLEDNKPVLYTSLTDENLGNSLTDGTNWERLQLGGGTSLQMFDTILKDHVLTYEESQGLALQGTYVYKTAIAGSRYGYPDFYNKCLEEYNEATTTETVNGVTVKVHSNGHKFYNIANKSAIDSFFNTKGSAWFYGVDTENERIFLPRNNYFDQATGDTSEVGLSVEAGLPNILGDGLMGGYTSYLEPDTNNLGAFYEKRLNNTHGNSGTSRAVQYGFDASRSSSIYGNSGTVQPNAVKKLLYICVGNTTNYKGVTDVVNQGMEILEQVNQGIESRVALDGSNAQFPFISETYVNGTSWYRIYSDGWCEQGGRVSSGSGASTVTLLKSYVNTNYNCQVTNGALDGSLNPQYWTRSITVKTVTSFTTNQYSDFFVGYEWRTAGYIR